MANAVLFFERPENIKTGRNLSWLVIKPKTGYENMDVEKVYQDHISIAPNQIFKADYNYETNTINTLFVECRFHENRTCGCCNRMYGKN